MSNKIIREQDTKERIDLLAKRLIVSSQSKPTKGTDDNIALSVLQGHLENSKTSIVAAKVILESNPSLERSLDILAGLIANPDGADGSNFLITSVVPEVGDLKVKKEDINNVIDFVSDYVNNTVKLRSKLEGIVKEILGVRGAHVELYIPDGVSEAMFNSLGAESVGTTEFTAAAVTRMRQSKQEKATATKSSDVGWDKTGLDFTSDWKTFLPKLVHTEKFTKVGNEADSARKVSLSRILKTRKHLKEVPMVSIKKEDVAKSRLTTMVKEVAAEAVHPICMNGDPDNVLGHIFLLDDNNGFIRIDDNIDFDETLRRKANDDTGNNALGRIAKSFKFGGTNEKAYSYAQARNLYDKFTKKVEGDMIKSLMEGNYVDNYSLSDDQQLSEIMFWRLLKEQKTRVLFVPESLVSYISFYKNAAGVGQSILTRAKLLSRLYTVLYYADYMSYLDSAIQRTEVTVTLDEADTNHSKTIESVLSEHAASRTNLLNVGAGDPAGAVEALSRHSTTVKVNGGGADSNTPQMDITEERIKREGVKIDSEYVANIKRDLTQKLNIPQQWVDNSWESNFKAEVVRDNELVRKQLAWYTNILNEGTTERVIKRVLNDVTLTQACLDLLSGNDEAYKKRVLEAILINLQVELPEVKTNGVEMNKDQLDAARDIIEDVVMDQFPDELVDQIDEIDTTKLEALRSAARAWLMRRYTKRSTMFGDMAEILEDPAQLTEIAKVEAERMVSIIKATEVYSKPVIKQDQKTGTKLDKVASGEDDEPEPTVEPEATGDDVVDDGTGADPTVEGGDDLGLPEL